MFQFLIPEARKFCVAIWRQQASLNYCHLRKSRGWGAPPTPPLAGGKKIKNQISRKSKVNPLPSPASGKSENNLMELAFCLHVCALFDADTSLPKEYILCLYFHAKNCSVHCWPHALRAWSGIRNWNAGPRRTILSRKSWMIWWRRNSTK